MAVTEELLRQVFKDVECIPDELSDDAFGIIYHDNQIIIKVNEGSHTVTIIDLRWYVLKSDDIEEMLRIIKLINQINIAGGIKMVYSVEDDNNVFISSSHTIPFLQEIPDLQSYLTEAIDQVIECRELLIKEQEETKN